MPDALILGRIKSELESFRFEVTVRDSADFDIFAQHTEFKNDRMKLQVFVCDAKQECLKIDAEEFNYQLLIVKLNDRAEPTLYFITENDFQYASAEFLNVDFDASNYEVRFNAPEELKADFELSSVIEHM